MVGETEVKALLMLSLQGASMDRDWGVWFPPPFPLKPGRERVSPGLRTSTDALEPTGGHRARARTSVHENQSEVCGALGELALSTWEIAGLVVFTSGARHRALGSCGVRFGRGRSLALTGLF